ncbi:Membrane alanine aminopeptidase N [Nitrosotalea devaniterrae]|uniref:Aminopeptidase n=1 Tax=Nitrosotalea devaniterrae TaxID=1078905 RepID=A0A128A4Q1_9ARCH|nr:Membrane alanine aminopeptidase N [Candidatus Nitrosotalea devanaterra]
MKSVSPVNYELTFEPDFKKFTFRGQEKISIKISRPTNSITLHAAELAINQCSAWYNGKKIIPKIKLDEKAEELTLVFSQKISGKATLEIDFTGQLNDKLVGFYRSKYEYKGKEKHLATTQFEAADARRAFPCWDEPEAKATFDVSLLVDSNHTAISNMPVISKKNLGHKTLYKFNTTPIMSTYLLYLAVGEFEYISSKSGKTLIRVITTHGKKHQGKLSLEFTKQFLSYFEKYFKISYPLPKLDMIAIPDFASGAMENWGAITFRETILLYDPKTSSTETKQHIAEVIAHEIAHQWFGNLVTMKWWNDLWLNESFATFMATKAVDALYPEWDFWDQFLISEMIGGLSLDSLKSSHPIDVPVKSPSDVRQIFDEISYNKGGCVLMMLENFIGDENFRKGLHSYLEKHEYANATTEDLWNSLGSISRQPVRQMMNTWVRQVGYPVIEAKVKNSRLQLSQSRFLLENNTKTKQRNWIIPLSVRMQDKTVTKLMKGPVTIPYKSDWFKVNDGQKGFYRVKYDKDARDALGEQIEEKAISNVDRWSIHHDLFALCVSGQISFRDYLDFVKHYQDEDDYIVLSDIIASLNFFYIILSKEEFWNEIKEFNHDFFNKVFSRLGWDQVKGEKSTTALLRGQVISSLGRLEDEEIVAEAKSRFANLLKTGQLHPDLRGPVYSVIAWTGDSSTYQKMLGLYRKAPTQEEMVRLLSSLANFQDKKLLSKTLLFTLSKEVRTQNLFQPIARMVINPQGKELVWPWIKQNWKGIVSRFGVGNPLLNRIIGSVSIEADFEKEKEIKKFFTKHHVPGTEMKLAQTLERIRIHARFSQNTRKEFN